MSATVLAVLAKLFRDVSRGCRVHSPLTHTLLTSAADDLDAGGVTQRMMAGSELDRAGTVPGLRFAAALHRLVLEGKAPALAGHYPGVGGTPRLATLWSDVHPVLCEHEDELRSLIRGTTVQTNEPGRTAPLYGGLLVAAERAARAAGRAQPFPVRLLEVGASGGLNLRPHLVGYQLSNGTVLGDPGSPLRFDPEWTGLPAADLTAPLVLHDRAACDVRPVDVTSEQGRLHLSSFVWADQLDRWNRLRAAIDLAVRDPVPVERATGADWLARRLAQPRPEVLTVVWHSVIWQYVSAVERARGRAVLAAAAARATADSPLALLVFEPRGGRFDLLLRLWPAGVSLHLGGGSGHGIPFTWDEQPWS
ncbi:DUF2332 domain-containing protein [Kutzneria albida]|uniref:DUF2332 domain-containing protein n=1 Tax=Kutzneria albida DSM 43870 TaxID=1449976 RepID=W5W0P3_9PSEU|nr:DUF2332 domain-containing protein [Kutzneria albida]AHH94355.1 hypothetical protein KALB_982 [Kutzneria albida DSM 43870]